MTGRLITAASRAWASNADPERCRNADLYVIQLACSFPGYSLVGEDRFMRVLLIEDDSALGEAVREHVASLGYGVDRMKRLDDARDAMATTAYELILLDLNLPDGRGLDFLRDLRLQGSRVPVIILTAQDQIASRIVGLNAGADDYLVKPFDLNELSARVGAVARRYGGNPNPLLRLGNLAIDLAQRYISVAGRPVDLTAREWAVFERLARRPNVMIAKSDIEDSLYEFGAEVDSNTVEVYVSRLRKKLGRDAIKTVRGAGYKISA
jgi:two-component system OmpR family response regulator